MRPKLIEYLALPGYRQIGMIRLYSFGSVPYSCLYFFYDIVFDPQLADLFEQRILLPLGCFGLFILPFFFKVRAYAIRQLFLPLPHEVQVNRMRSRNFLDHLFAAKCLKEYLGIEILVIPLVHARLYASLLDFYKERFHTDSCSSFLR